MIATSQKHFIARLVETCFGDQRSSPGCLLFPNPPFIAPLHHLSANAHTIDNNSDVQYNGI